MDAPLLSAARLCWAATDAGSRFHSELCTALPPPTRAQPRPPTRTTAPQEDAVQKCAKFRQSPRNWHTHCCRETGVRRGDGGWCRAVKMEMRYAMVRRSHHGPWTSAVKRSIGEVVQLRRRPLLLVESRYYRLLSTFTYRGINARLA